MARIFRVYAEKKKSFAVEAQRLLHDLRELLGISGLSGLRLLQRYDVSGISGREYRRARSTIFSEPPLDHVYDETFPRAAADTVFGIEYLPGQYDQRADSAAQCLQLISGRQPPLVRHAKIIVLEGAVRSDELARIKGYCINPVDSCEAALSKPQRLAQAISRPPDVEQLAGFRRPG